MTGSALGVWMTVACAVGREEVFVGFGPGRLIGPPAQAARKIVNKTSFIQSGEFHSRSLSLSTNHFPAQDGGRNGTDISQC